MEKRLIDADALSQEIESLRVTVSGRPATLDDAKSDVLRVIDEQKTVDAAPVVPGQWVGSGDGYADGELVYDMWACSECGYDADGADENHNGDSAPAAARRWMEAMTYA